MSAVARASLAPPMVSDVLRGRVAVVTGAAGLLGRQHAAALAAAHAQVVLVDLDQAAVDDATTELAAWSPHPAVGVAADVTDPRCVRALRDLILVRFGRVDVLVNNAAVNDRVESPELGLDASRFEHYPIEQWRRVMDVNVTGVFLPSQQLGAAMAAAGRGSIINVASTYGLVAPDPQLYARPDGSIPYVKSAAYPASKGAVLALTRFIAAYWGHAGVRANALVPGGVENGQEPWFIANYARRTPLGRMARADDYRGAVVFLASDASRYVTGTALVVDGGFTTW